jgi:hypothetical protein
MNINKQLKVCTCLCPSLKKTTTRFPNIFVRCQIQKIGKLNKLTGFCCKTKRSKQELKLSKVKTKRSKQELKSSKVKTKRSKQDSYNHLSLDLFLLSLDVFTSCLDLLVLTLYDFSSCLDLLVLTLDYVISCLDLLVLTSDDCSYPV